ncbi:MAG: translation initiation factor eIF-2B [Thermoplasmatota archaeon]|nr:S-methyl-5-thioribose-1-phosphate isomerase [Halobacteriales archaeon]
MASAPLLAAVEDIRAMRVRGAAAIACAAAKALAASVAATPGDLPAIQSAAREGAATLLASRPTAVSLRHGLAPILAAVSAAAGPDQARHAALEAAASFAAEVKASEKAIARHGATAIRSGERILTHCHSATVVSVLAAAQEQGKAPQVFATETRPFRQGLVTARWLREAGVATTLVVDSAALHVLRTEDIDRVLVGADTVAGDGSLFNKIGTSQVALGAHAEEVPFWSAASWIKFTPDAPGAVVVEERASDEVAAAADIPAGLRIRNPVFDRTPPEHVTGFVTEEGLVPPRDAVAAALRRLEVAV